jgi:hypothetical protein
MYGDVFGNRDPEVYGQQEFGRESGSRTPTDTHTPTYVHRWQPVFEQERITARYGTLLPYSKPIAVYTAACQPQTYCFLAQALLVNWA